MQGYRALWLYSTLALTLFVSLPLSAFSQTVDLYESDFSTSSVMKITPGGMKSVFASDLQGPWGLAFDKNGSLFVANILNDGGIFKVAPDGTKTIFDPGFPNGAGSAHGLAFDKNGELFVSDDSSDRILKFDPNGTPHTFAAGLQAPAGLAFDSSGNLYAAQPGSGMLNGTIEKFTPGGLESTFASGFGSPDGIAFDSTDNLYVVDNVTHNVSKITPGGQVSTFASQIATYGIALDGSDNVYVSVVFGQPPGTGAIVKITQDGTQSTIATGLLMPTYLAVRSGVSAVPEPDSIALLVSLGVTSLYAVRRLRLRKKPWF